PLLALTQLPAFPTRWTAARSAFFPGLLIGNPHPCFPSDSAEPAVRQRSIQLDGADPGLLLQLQIRLALLRLDELFRGDFAPNGVGVPPVFTDCFAARLQAMVSIVADRSLMPPVLAGKDADGIHRGRLVPVQIEKHQQEASEKGEAEKVQENRRR